MKGIRNPIVVSFIYVVSIIWLWLGDNNLMPKPFCPFRKISGIPCPGCGGTRSTVELLHGHLIDALKINPLSVVFCLFLLLILFTVWCDYLYKTNYLATLTVKRWPNYITIPLFVFAIVVWIRNIYIGI